MNANSLSFKQLCELFNYIPKYRPLRTEDLVDLAGLARNTWEQHRLKGTGPRFFQPPGTRCVFYAEPDVLAWLASGARNSTSQEPGAALCA